MLIIGEIGISKELDAVGIPWDGAHVSCHGISSVIIAKNLILTLLVSVQLHATNATMKDLEYLPVDPEVPRLGTNVGLYLYLTTGGVGVWVGLSR